MQLAQQGEVWAAGAETALHASSELRKQVFDQCCESVGGVEDGTRELASVRVAQKDLLVRALAVRALIGKKTLP